MRWLVFSGTETADEMLLSNLDCAVNLESYYLRRMWKWTANQARLFGTFYCENFSQSFIPVLAMEANQFGKSAVQPIRWNKMGGNFSHLFFTDLGFYDLWVYLLFCEQ